MHRRSGNGDWPGDNQGASLFHLLGGKQQPATFALKSSTIMHQFIPVSLHHLMGAFFPHYNRVLLFLFPRFSTQNANKVRLPTAIEIFGTFVTRHQIELYILHYSYFVRDTVNGLMTFVCLVVAAAAAAVVWLTRLHETFPQRLLCVRCCC